VDDLPSHRPLVSTHPPASIAGAMLDAFARHSVPEVYGFVNGAKLLERPDDLVVLETWLSKGHILGNHTWAHGDLHTIPAAAFATEITRNEELLRDLQPEAPDSRWRVFRYPFLHEGLDLDTRKEVRTHLHRAGYRIAPVTIDPYDWAYGDAYERCLARGKTAEVEAIRAAFLSEARAKLWWAVAEAEHLAGRPIRHVLLLHPGVIDADTIDDLLTSYEKAGVQWITLDQALADPVYAQDPNVARGGMFLFQVAEAKGAMPPPQPAAPIRLLETLCVP
jgi:peptidoglycan-N-acetylglucosamine deacetylase